MLKQKIQGTHKTQVKRQLIIRLTTGALITAIGVLGLLEFNERVIREDVTYVVQQHEQRISDIIAKYAQANQCDDYCTAQIELFLASAKRNREIEDYAFFAPNGTLLFSSNENWSFDASNPAIAETVKGVHGVNDAQHSIMLHAVTPGSNGSSNAKLPIIRDGRHAGTLALHIHHANPNKPLHQALKYAWLFASLALLVFSSGIGLLALEWIKSRRLQQKHIHYMAMHDELTGSLNRTSFYQALEHSLSEIEKNGAPIAVLCIDLDYFKTVNDTLGHLAGDQVLRDVISRLHKIVRQRDLIARLGGDEFAILQTHADTTHGITHLGNRIIEALSLPFTIQGRQVSIGASVGAACTDKSTIHSDTLMHNADIAMYRAKRLGRSQFCLYDPVLDSEIQYRGTQIAALKEAINKEQLVAKFSPIYAGNLNMAVGYEATLHWLIAESEWLDQSEILSIGEEAGLNRKIWEKFLYATCQEAARDTDGAFFSLAPPNDFLEWGEKFSTSLDKTISNLMLDPKKLEIQISSSQLLDACMRQDPSMAAVFRHNIRIALNDYGAEQSNLIQLWKGPASRMMLSTCFTDCMESDERAAAIVRSVIEMAHALNLKVAAKIRSEEEAERMWEMGFDEVQLAQSQQPAASSQHYNINIGIYRYLSQ